MTARSRFVTVSFLLAAAMAMGSRIQALAAPPPPPDPQRVNQIAAASCGNRTNITLGEPISVTAKALTAESLGIHDLQDKMTFLWGLRLTSEDKRFGGIVGLEASNTFGLLAVTDTKHWLSFVVSGAQQVALKAVRIAPLRGGKGTPSGLRQVERSYYLGSSDSRTLSRFELARCGLDANGIHFLDAAKPVTALAPVAYSYTLFIGRPGSDGVRNESVGNLNFGPAPKLDRPEVPPIDKHVLTDVANPNRIVPAGLVGLWTPSDGKAGSVIQLFDLPQWGDTGPPIFTDDQILARMSLTFRALAVANLGDRYHIILASYAEPGAPTFIAVFSYTL